MYYIHFRSDIMASDSPKPLYQRIFEHLQEKILSGELGPGDRIPTEMDLMGQYSTSRITASRAVKELEHLGYLTRVKAKGSFVQPKSQWMSKAQTIQSGRKKTIAFIIPAPAGKISIEMEVLHGVELACAERGYNLSVKSLDKNRLDNIAQRALEKDLVEDMHADGTAGAIIYPQSTFDSPEMYNRMACRSLPFVMLDRKVFGIDASIASCDNKGSFNDIVQHIIDQGHRRIAFVSGNTYESSSRTERYEGYIKAMNENRLEIIDDLILHNLFPTNYRNTYYAGLEARDQTLRESIRTMLSRFLCMELPPTAIATSNDYIALNIMNEASDLGIRIPEDISLTGFDGLSICAFFRPRLTTIHQDFTAIGQATVDLLDQKIRDPLRRPDERRIPAQLQLGETVAKVN
jgi:DNA-binding LacI/PurR family transcriptional regulator